MGSKKVQHKTVTLSLPSSTSSTGSTCVKRYVRGLSQHQQTTLNSFYPLGALKHPYPSLSVLIRHYPPLSVTIRHFGDSLTSKHQKVKDSQ